MISELIASLAPWQVVSLYCLYAYVQAVIMVRYGFDEKTFGAAMGVFIFAPVMTVVIICGAIYEITKLLIGAVDEPKRRVHPDAKMPGARATR